MPEVFQPPPRTPTTPTTSSGATRPAPPPPPAPKPRPPTQHPKPNPPTPTEAAPSSPRRNNNVPWLLAAAGLTYLGARLFESRQKVEEEGDVVVLEPGDEVMVEGDGETEEVYDPAYEQDDRENHDDEP